MEITHKHLVNVVRVSGAREAFHLVCGLHLPLIDEWKTKEFAAPCYWLSKVLDFDIVSQSVKLNISGTKTVPNHNIM